MPGFSVGPGGAVLVTCSYVVKSVQTQVVLQGATGREGYDRVLRFARGE